jgi:hypothetical protein
MGPLLSAFLFLFHFFPARIYPAHTVVSGACATPSHTDRRWTASGMRPCRAAAHAECARVVHACVACSCVSAMCPCPAAVYGVFSPPRRGFAAHAHCTVVAVCSLRVRTRCGRLISFHLNFSAPIRQEREPESWRDVLLELEPQ